MGALWNDLKYGIRMLVKSPGFTAVAVLTLALGIGANTAIFSVVNSTLLAPLPFKDASQLVNLHARATFFDFWNLGLSLPDIKDIRSRSKCFAAVAPFQYAPVDLIGRDAPRELDAAKVPADFFSILGLKPVYGRAFLPSEMQSGADREAILSGTLWRTQFGSDPRVVGTRINLDGKPYTVVGVMPELQKMAFSPVFVDIWIPFAPTSDQLAARGMHGIPTIARLIPGITIRQAQAELDGIAARLAKAYPNDDKDWSFRADSLRSDMNRNSETPLLVLLGAVGFVLLIACANVGNLFLSRGWARRRELAIRSTLGATRGRLIRQLLVESLLLAVAGGACGLLLAYWSVDALRALMKPILFSADKVSIDVRVLLFTLGISILAGLLFGLAPAFLSSRHDLATAMKESGAGAQTGASSSRHNPLRQILVVAEIALALVLVIGATLALRSFSRLLSVNLGFDTAHVLDMRLDFPETKFKNSDEMFAYLRSVVDHLRAAPGVESVSLVGNTPLSGAHGEGNFSIQGVPENPKAPLTTEVSGVGPAYFQTMKIPLLRGRDFTTLDSGKFAEVMIVSRAFAQKFFGGQDPIGKRIFMGDEDAKHNKIWEEVVGEAGDVHDRNPGIAFVQRPNEVKTLQQRLDASVASPRLQSFLLGAFGALGLLLAVVGVYGVISYSVTQRTHEIGIRMALGAEPTQMMRLILSHGLKLSTIGVVIGIGASLALTRLMSSLLFGVSATDPVTFAGVAILLGLVSLAACYVPARRAMRVDPMIALRYE